MIAELSISKEAKTMIDLSRLAEFQPPPDKRMELASFIPGPDSGAGPDTISNDAFYGRDLSPNKTESRLSLAADISDNGGGSPGFPSHEASHADTQKAEQKANLCRQFVQMTMDGPLSGNQAAAALGRSAAWFSINVPEMALRGPRGLPSAASRTVREPHFPRSAGLVFACGPVFLYADQSDPLRRVRSRGARPPTISLGGLTRRIR